MKTLLLLFLSFTLFSSAQSNTNSYEFKFYRNGSFPKTKKLKVYAISENDTILCAIKDDRIALPKLSTVGSILINFRKISYQIEEIDFSKLKDRGSLFIGIENNMNNFTQPLPTKQPEFYILNDYAVILQLKDYESINKICFLSFSTIVSDEGDKVKTAQLSKYTIL